MTYSKEQSKSRREKLIVTGALAMFAMGGLRAEATTNREADEHKPVPPANDEKTDAVEGQVRPTQTIHHFTIPAGTLREVSAAVEKETGLKITVPARFADVPSPGVNGAMTTQEAFDAMLKGTNVAATFVSPERVTLDVKAADSVTVSAPAELPSLKYTAPLRDLPQTLTIIPETVLQNTASTSLVDALRTVSGITFGAGEGGNPIGDRPYIRGVDSQSSTFVDNVRDIGSQSREVFDIASVEVSKGPSGGFAGRGASGGSININSKMAERSSFGNVSFSPGSASFYRGTFDGNTKLGRLGYGRLNGMAQDTGVPGRDQVHSNRYGFAPSLLFSMGNRARVFANYYDLRSNDLPDPGIPYNNPTFFARVDGRQQIFSPGDGQPLLVNRNAFYGLASRDFRYEKVKTAFGRAEFNISDKIVLRNNYRYGKSNQDYLYSQPDDSQGNIYYGLLYRRALNRNTFVDTSVDQTDLAGQAKTGAITHNFATGFEFSRERSWNQAYGLGIYTPPNLTTNTNATVAIPSFTVRNAATNQYVSVAGSRCPFGAGAAGGYFCTDLFKPSYGDPSTVGVIANNAQNPSATVTSTLVKNLTPPTKQRTITSSLYGFDTVQFLPQLQATVGVRYDHYDTTFRTAPLPNGVSTTTPYTSDIVNYQVGVVYKPIKAASLYGSVSSSATPPGNALLQGSDPSALATAGNNVLPPEKNRSEEAGVKWEVGSAKALVTAAYFQSDIDNVRITNADGTIGVAGKRRNRGLDTGISGYITRKWQVFGGYTYMSAILVEAGGSGTASGLMNGRRFPNTAENSFSMTSYYQVNRRLSLGGGVYATGKVFGNDSPTIPKWVPAYGRFDLFGSYTFTRHLSLQANLQNVADKTYYLQAYTTHYATLGPGRQGRGTLTYRF